jgi:hypothetical protein
MAGSRCIIRVAGSYPGQATTWQPPAFNDLIVHPFHVGTFHGPAAVCKWLKFLDVIAASNTWRHSGSPPSSRCQSWNRASRTAWVQRRPSIDYHVEGVEFDASLPCLNRSLLTRIELRGARRAGRSRVDLLFRRRTDFHLGAVPAYTQHTVAN